MEKLYLGFPHLEFFGATPIKKIIGKIKSLLHWGFSFLTSAQKPSVLRLLNKYLSFSDRVKIRRQNISPICGYTDAFGYMATYL